MAEAGVEKRDIQGRVVRRDPDGYGLVELTVPENRVMAFFTGEVLQNPMINKRCYVGQTVTGRAEIRNGGYRIIHLEPK